MPEKMRYKKMEYRLKTRFFTLIIDNDGNFKDWMKLIYEIIKGVIVITFSVSSLITTIVWEFFIKLPFWFIYELLLCTLSILLSFIGLNIKAVMFRAVVRDLSNKD